MRTTCGCFFPLFGKDETGEAVKTVLRGDGSRMASFKAVNSFQFGLVGQSAVIGGLIGIAIVQTAIWQSKRSRRHGLFLRRRPKVRCPRCSGFGIVRCKLCGGEGVVVRGDSKPFLGGERFRSDEFSNKAVAFGQCCLTDGVDSRPLFFYSNTEL